jgi:hypothetical protein
MKRLADEGVSTSDLNDLALLSKSADKNATNAIAAIIGGRPLWAEPELKAGEVRDANYKATNNREAAQAIGGELNARDTEDAMNGKLDQQAQQTLQRQTDQVIASEGGRVAGEEAGAMRTAEQDLADTKMAEETAKRDAHISKLIPTMDEKSISNMLMDMLIENPARATFLWGDDLRRSFAEAAASFDKHVSKQGKLKLAEALKETAAVVKKMGKLPKGF